MNFFSSLLFLCFLNLWGAIIPILYFPVFITRNRKLADHGAKVWSNVSLWVLKKLCNIDHQIIGLENLPKEPCIIACKHQSAWETIIMHLIFNQPVYAYKKELEKIPFYGWFLGIMSGIRVDREGGIAAIKQLIKQSKEYLNAGQNIIIFPQGTRVPVKATPEIYPYQAGITALYLSCNVKVVPAALNSGLFWSKEKISKKPGKITLKFLEPISTGLSKQEFSEKLITAIESNSEELASY